jgi:hypothetical protein
MHLTGYSGLCPLPPAGDAGRWAALGRHMYAGCKWLGAMIDVMWISSIRLSIVGRG